MELKEVFALMERFEASALTELEYSRGEDRIRLSRAAGPVYAPAAAMPAAVPVSVPAPAEPALAIRAPLVGTFYLAANPGGPAFAPVGTRVEKGQTVCILEAMKMMSEVPAPFACVIEEVLAENAALVEFDQPLFRVREA